MARMRDQTPRPISGVEAEAAGFIMELPLVLYMIVEPAAKDRSSCFGRDSVSVAICFAF